MSFNVLIIGSERSAGFNFAKSLQSVKSEGLEDVCIVGTSAHPARAFLTANDVTLSIDEEQLRSPIQAVRRSEDLLGEPIDLVYETRSGQPMLNLSKARSFLPTFLPSEKAVATFEDKYSTFHHLRRNGFVVPDTQLLNESGDVYTAINRQSQNGFWIRRRMGYAGSGAFASSDADEIVASIEEQKGWGEFVMSKRLPSDEQLDWNQRLSDDLHPGEMVNWIALYQDDRLIACQGRKRLYFEHKSLTPGGVSHTGGLMTYSDSGVSAHADTILRSFGFPLNGALGIDFLVDETGQLNVTEIQPCRFYTTTYYLSRLGLNLPKLYVQAFRGSLENAPALVDPIATGRVWLQRFGADDMLVDRQVMLTYLDSKIARFPHRQKAIH